MFNELRFIKNNEKILQERKVVTSFYMFNSFPSFKKYTSISLIFKIRL